MHREEREFKGGPGEGHGGEREQEGCEDGERRGQQQDHAAHTAQLWEGAFGQALHELRVEAVKAKLKGSPFTKNLDATAKEVVAAMYKEWQAFQAREQEKEKKKDEPAGPEGLKALFKDAKKGPR